MATERNPFEQIPQEIANVIPMEATPISEDQEATFEVDPDGGVTVDFTKTVVMEAEAPVKEWYANLAEDIDDGELEEIADNVYKNYDADKNSRQVRYRHRYLASPLPNVSSKPTVSRIL